MKGTLVLFGAIVAGNLLAEKFILKAGADDPTGFITVNDGLGLDDVARAATIIAVAWVGKKFIGG